MKMYLRFTGLFVGLVCMAAISLAQTAVPDSWEDVILEERGDTVVVKPSSMAPGYLNTLFYAIMGDTTETGERKNLNRVYETVRGHAYIYDKESTIDASVPKIRIWAPPGTDTPPLHYKTLDPEGKFKKAFFKLSGGEFYMENQYILQALINDTRDRNWFRTLGDNMRIEFKNCVVEESNWAWITMAGNGTTIKVTDCLIMNIGAESSLEKGNIYDGKTPLDTVWFENNTILNSGNFMVVRDGAAPNFIYFNHNTLVNNHNNPFYFWAQGEQIVTNNIFMNTGFVPDYPNFYPFYEDSDKLPKGIINVDTVDNAWKENFWGGNYPFEEADRKILVDRNSVSWDPRFQDMFDNDLAPFPDTINEVWASQMITMNTRTQAMFDDDAAYPYFKLGHWYEKQPDFANNRDMVPEWIDYVVSQAVPGAANSGTVNMDTTNWRTNWKTQLTIPDWPILPDLSYSDGELANGAVSGYPLGDLNWFPSEKASWEIIPESDILIAAMKAGDLPDWPVSIDDNEAMKKVRSPQVSAYPNPFSNTTTVRFEIASSTDVQLIVYNIIGERVRLLELGQHGAGIHEATLDREGLNAGMYILQINTEYNKAGLTTKISIK